eukprot:6149140-Prymnesium_polylepis.2
MRQPVQRSQRETSRGRTLQRPSGSQRARLPALKLTLLDFAIPTADGTLPGPRRILRALDVLIRAGFIVANPVASERRLCSRGNLAVGGPSGTRRPKAVSKRRRTLVRPHPKTAPVLPRAAPAQASQIATHGPSQECSPHG